VDVLAADARRSARLEREGNRSRLLRCVFRLFSLGGAPFDWMLVGTRNLHGPITEARFSAPWRDPALSARLREVAFESPEQIGAAFLADGASCGSWLPACRR